MSLLLPAFPFSFINPHHQSNSSTYTGLLSVLQMHQVYSYLRIFLPAPPSALGLFLQIFAWLSVSNHSVFLSAAFSDLATLSLVDTTPSLFIP